MIKEAMEKFESAILAGTKPQTIEIKDKTYYVDPRGKLDRIMTDQEMLETVSPPHFEFLTLTALANFINENPDNFEPGQVVIDSPLQVSWHGNVKTGVREKKRFLYAFARQDETNYIFGDINESEAKGPWYQLEMFVIALQSQFVQTETVSDIIRYLSDLHNEKVVNVNDDTFTQKLQIKTGITTKSEVEIKNPVKLAPYRTFMEVEQPESDFVLRFRESKGIGIECALFEADGLGWRLDAMRYISSFLEYKLLKSDIILW